MNKTSELMARVEAKILKVAVCRKELEAELFVLHSTKHDVTSLQLQKIGSEGQALKDLLTKFDGLKKLKKKPEPTTATSPSLSQLRDDYKKELIKMKNELDRVKKESERLREVEIKKIRMDARDQLLKEQTKQKEERREKLKKRKLELAEKKEQETIKKRKTEEDEIRRVKEAEEQKKRDEEKKAAAALQEQMSGEFPKPTM